MSFRSVVVLIEAFLIVKLAPEFNNLAISFKSVVVFVEASTLILPPSLTMSFKSAVVLVMFLIFSFYASLLNTIIKSIEKQSKLNTVNRKYSILVTLAVVQLFYYSPKNESVSCILQPFDMHALYLLPLPLSN